MTYHIHAIPNHFQVLLDDAPSNCIALAEKPVYREDVLNHGLWLVLVFAEWSARDYSMIEVALQTAKQLEEQHIKVGIRPFDEYTEIATWCADVDRPLGIFQTPLWLILYEGQLIKQFSRFCDEKTLVSIMTDIQIPVLKVE